MGENQVGVPGCDVVGSTADEIRGAHDGICTGSGQSTFGAAGGSGGAVGSVGAHDGRTEGVAAGAGGDEAAIGAAGVTVGATGAEVVGAIGAGAGGVGGGSVDGAGTTTGGAVGLGAAVGGVDGTAAGDSTAAAGAGSHSSGVSSAGAGGVLGTGITLTGGAGGGVGVRIAGFGGALAGSVSASGVSGAAGGVDGFVADWASSKCSAAGGVEDSGDAALCESKDSSGQLGMGCELIAGSRSSSEGGGHAGMALSVGGSGGQMSVSAGGAGALSDAGGHVDFVASEATAFGGSVMGASFVSTGSPGEVGTVSAQAGLADPFSSWVPESVCDQSGSPFCIGRAGSASSAAGASAEPLSSAGVTGTV